MKKRLTILSICISLLALTTIGQTTFSEKATVTTRVIVLPPYPLSFNELMTKQGNAVVFQNLSVNPQKISVNLNFSSMEGNVSINSIRPILSIDLAPLSSRTIPLSQLVGGLNNTNITCAGLASDAAFANRSLPDGYYTLCITPRTLLNNGNIGQEGCSAIIPIMAIEPPTLRLANATNNDTIINIAPQNLLFQWNTPFGLRPNLIGTLKTVLKIVEVPKGVSPTQAVLSAPVNTPQFTIAGQNQFIYGPTFSPLIKGRRYAAVLQVADPRNSVTFRNNGVSEVLSFVYGKPQTNVLTTNTSNVNGTVLWAYKATEEVKSEGNVPLVSKSIIKERRQEIIKNNSAGKETFPLQDALVSVYGTNNTALKDGTTATKSPIGTTKTDANGHYNLDLILQNAMKKFKYILIEISHPSGLFNKTIQTVTYNSLINGVNLQPIVLTGQTIELTPRVILQDGSLNKDASINILLPEKQWSKYAVLESAEIGNTNKTASYNNQTYRVVTSISNGNTYKKLFQTVSPNEHYLVQINIPNKPSTFYPLDGVYVETFDNLGQKPIIEIAKNYLVNNTNTLSGKVSYVGSFKANVRIEASISPSDIVSEGYEAIRTFTAITNNEGKYTLSGIPNLKPGAAIRFNIIDKTISHSTTTDELIVRKNDALIKDFTLKVNKKVVTGQLIDIYGSPIANAAVLASSSNKMTVSDDNGNYAIELESDEISTGLKFMADGYRDTSIAVKTTLTRRQKNNALSNSINQGKTVLNPFASNSSIVFNVIKEEDKSNIRSGTLTLESVKGLFKPVIVDLSKINTNGFTYTIGQNYDAAGYKVSYTPTVANKSILAPTSTTVSLPPANSFRVIVMGVSTTKTIAGVVKKDVAAGAPIAQQTVTIANSTYQAISDKSGRFQIVLPLNQLVRIQATRTGFLAYDSTFTGLNDTVILRSSITQTFKTLLGFPATITFIKEITKGSSYIISGYISVANNNNFSITGSNSLYFNNVTVAVDNGTNAILPSSTTTVPLTTASVQLNAFGFAPVQVTNLTLKPVSGATTTGQLTGKLIVYPTVPSTATFALPNATVVDMVAKTDSLNTTFALSSTNTLSKSSYRLYFKSSGYTSVDMTNLNSTLYFDTATLSTSGITNLHGYLQLNTILGFTPSNSGKINVKSGIIGTDFNLKTLNFSAGTSTILSASLQKLKADFNDIIIAGLNTTNAKLLFGGNLTIGKGIASTPFSSMGLVKTVIGFYALSSSINLTNPFTVNSFTFKPVANSTNSFSYSTQNKTYILSFPVGINVSSLTSSNAAVSAITSAVFPNDISAQFNLQSSNWGVIVAPTANQTVNLGLAVINIGNFLISIGNNTSINAIDSIVLGKKNPTAAINNDTTLIDASVSDWAYGIAGSVSFPMVKSMTGNGISNSGAGILVFSKTAQYGLQARVDTLYMKISTSAMIATAGGTMTFDNDKKGFAVSASVVVYNVSPENSLDKKGIVYKGFAASYKFYQYATGGIELGASILVSTDIRVGPVTFHSLGGGFDFDTKFGQYNVFINGDLGPTGVPAFLIDVPVYLNVQFSSACNYMPVITGTGSEIIGTILKVGNSSIVIDMCNKYLLATVNQDLNLPTPLNLVKMRRSGTLFIAIPGKNSPNGCFYLEMDMNVNIPYLLSNADAGMGIGYNVTATNEYIPASAMQRLTSFVGSGTLNGLFVYADLAQSTSGNYRFGFKGFNANLAWNESINYGLTFFTNLTGDITVNLASNLKVHVGGSFGLSLYGFGASLGGSLDVGTTLNGAYSPSAGFNLAGTGSAQFQVYGGSSDAANIGCNTVNITYGSYTEDTPFGSVTIDYPDGIEAKVCFGVGLSFGIKSGKAPYATLSF